MMTPAATLLGRPRAANRLSSPFPALFHDIRWYHLQRKPDADRDEDQVVEVTEHGYEVRDEVDRAECISHYYHK